MNMQSKSLRMLLVSFYSLSLFVGFVKTDRFMQQAIRAFAKVHSVNCHTLLFTYSDELYDQRKLLDFYKAIINDNFVPTALENISNDEKLKAYDFRRIRCSRSLRSFIMGDVTHILQYMIEGSLRGDIRKDQWLLFVANDSVQEFITTRMELTMRSEVFIARKTTNGFEFLEVYQPAKNNPISINYYGNWNNETGIKVEELSVLERRRDFGGAIIQAAKFETEETDYLRKDKYVKILEVIWLFLEKELNFTTEYVVIPDNSSKQHGHKHSSNIIVQMLAKNKADVSLVGLPLTMSALNDIDYSTPLFRMNSRVWIMEPDFALESWWHFLHPLSAEGWHYVVLTIALIPLIIILMFYISRKIGLIKTEHNFLDLCMTVYQMLCVQGGDLQQELYSISLVFVVFNLWAFLIRAMYSAALASTLAIKHYDPPFSSLTELLENGQYEFGVNRHSSAFEIYYKMEDSFIKKLNQATMDQNISNLPTSYLEGLQRICSQKNYAFMAHESTILELKSQIPCKLHPLKNEEFTVSIAYAMSKHNAYLPFINRWLYILNQYGLMVKLKRDIISNEFLNFDNEHSIKSLDLGDAIFVQLLLIIGILLSVGILCAEIVCNRMRRNRIASNC